MSELDDTVKSVFTGGYVHRATVRCWSCGGSGVVQGYPCGICIVSVGDAKGVGAFEAGCGGPAEMDEHYGSAYCQAEGRFVPREEVRKA